MKYMFHDRVTGAAYPGNCAVLCTQTGVLGKTFFIANSSKYADKDI